MKTAPSETIRTCPWACTCSSLLSTYSAASENQVISKKRIQDTAEDAMSLSSTGKIAE